MEKDKGLDKTDNELTLATLMGLARAVKDNVPRDVGVTVRLSGLGSKRVRQLDMDLYKMANGGSEDGFDGNDNDVKATILGVNLDIRS